MFRHETENLVGYLDGGLSEPARERVERHLASCARCRAALAELRAAQAALEAAGADAPAPSHNADLWARVRAEIAPAPRVRTGRRPLWALAGGAVGFAAAAASLALWLARPAPKPMITAEPPPAAHAPAPAQRPQPAPRPRDRQDIREAKPPPPEAEPRPMPAGPPRTRPEPRRLARLEPPPETPMRAVPPPAPPVDRTPTPAAEPAPPVDAPAPAALNNEVRTLKAAPQAEAHDEPAPATPAAPAPAPLAGGFGGQRPAPRAAAPRERMALRGAPAPATDAAEASPTKASRQMKATLEGQRAFQRANVAMAQGRASEAMAAYREALTEGVTPTEARVAHLRLGDAAVRAGDDETARAEFTAAVEIAKDAETLNRLGAVYERLGDIPKAINAYEQSLILQPGNATARAGLSRLKP